MSGRLLGMDVLRLQADAEALRKELMRVSDIAAEERRVRRQLAEALRQVEKHAAPLCELPEGSCDCYEITWAALAAADALDQGQS